VLVSFGYLLAVAMMGFFLFITVPKPDLEPTQSPIKWVPGAHSKGAKMPGREADHSPPSSAEVRKAWSYTSAPQYAFMTWCLVNAQGQLYLYLYLYLAFDNILLLMGGLL